MKKLFSLLLALTMFVPCLTLAEESDNAWYNDMLEKAGMYHGNNRRLHNVLERARNGEKITVAVIGGSITEGAGAAKYEECWARRLLDGLRAEWGAGDGSNIGLINAGVGGTASTFGWMRYERDILNRVQDDDGLPDLVVIEYAVNDGGEPTRHGCYESMVQSILSAENAPAVILLFSVFPGGYTLQNDLMPIGKHYDLSMVSMRNSAYPLIGNKWTNDEFFFDQYHPTSLGHQVMADCILATIRADMARDVDSEDITFDPTRPVYSTAYIGMKRIFGDTIPEDIAFSAGGFNTDDGSTYSNLPVGRVCGKNFSHAPNGSQDPITFTASFKNMLISYRTVSGGNYGTAEVYIDGEKVQTLNAVVSGAWGQSETRLVFSAAPAKEHVVEIRMAEGSENKRFTITGIAFTP